MNNVKARYFKRALRKAGLRDIRFHDLRHTYASLLLAQGEPVTYVANQLGHANPGITLKIYSHWIPKESQREAVNKLPSLSRQLEVRSAKAL
jgi:integrase